MDLSPKRKTGDTWVRSVFLGLASPSHLVSGVSYDPFCGKTRDPEPDREETLWGRGSTKHG